MKSILYLLLYFIVIYEVYFISHFLSCYGGFGGDFFMFVFWISHFILFCILQYKFVNFKKSNKIVSILIIISISLLPIYFNIKIMINSSPRFKYKLEEIANEIEIYRKRKGYYPSSLDSVASPLNRFITFPYYFLLFLHIFFPLILDNLFSYYKHLLYFIGFSLEFVIALFL